MKGEHGFLKGMGIGMLAGTTVGMMLMPRKRKDHLKRAAERATKRMGHAMEDLADDIGIY